MRNEHLKTWRRDGFSLSLWQTGRTDRWGKSILAYQLSDHGTVIFTGSDYHCSPMHAIDSDEAAEGLLAFLSLRDGDTDDEYFAAYTPTQLAFRDSSRCEELSLWQFDLQEQFEKARN